MQKAEIKAYTKEVAEKLGEYKDIPVRQIEAIITHMGRDFVEEHLAQTVQAENEGGLMIEGNRRRRTVGGVFFYLLKDKIPQEKKRDIYPNYGNNNRGKVVEWEKRLEHIKHLLEQAEELHGEMQYVNVTLHGRVGEVYKHDNSVITTIRHVHKSVPMPKGVPTPPTDPITYVVYMAAKHWEPVEKALKKNPNERLVIEGTVVLDHETQTLALLAQSVLTKQMYKQVRKSEESKSTQNKAKQQSQQPKAEPKPPQMSDKDAKKVKELQQAAETLRGRLESMQQEGKTAGLKTTETLLKRTEKQIEAIERKYS